MNTPRQRSNKTAPARVLVHAPNWVGDHAMAFPFYAALRELLPQAQLHLIGRAWAQKNVTALPRIFAACFSPASKTHIAGNPTTGMNTARSPICAS
jgi:ADP-heptose:LPS heptosyltransferase